MTIFLHECKMSMKTWAIWTISVAGMIFCFMLLFPEYTKGMNGMQDLYKNMGSFSAAFGLDKVSMATATGFYAVEAGTMLSLGGAMFAALLGCAALAKEEGGHTVEFLLTTPNSRIKVILQKCLAISALILLFNLVCMGAAALSFFIIDEDLSGKEFLLYHMAQFIMQLEIGYVAFAISAFMRKSNVGLGLGLAILLYFSKIFVNISDKTKFMKYITPFQYSDGTEIYGNGFVETKYLLIGVAIGIISLMIAFIRYHKKDMQC